MLDRDPTPIFPNRPAPDDAPPLRLLPPADDRSRRRPSTPPRHGAPSPVRLAPLLAAAEPIEPEIEQRLTHLAIAARAGDRDARDALFLAFSPKIDRMLGRSRRRLWTAGGPRRDGRPWDLDDLAQEAYAVFVGLLADWSAQGAVTPYLLAHLPWRLATAGRRLTARRGRERPMAPHHTDLLADGSAAADEARVLVEAIAAVLPPPDGDLLLLLIRDGRSPAAAARRLGLSRRTVDRRWAALRVTLRQSLLAPAPPPPLP